MKLIIAIVNPYKQDDVKTALSEIGVEGMTVTEVKGFGRQKGHTEIYRGSEYAIEFVPKIKFEIALREDIVPQAMDAIAKAASTGKIGDGKIFVVPLDAAMRIRTGEVNEQAL